VTFLSDLKAMIMTKYFYLVALFSALSFAGAAQNNSKTINITNFTVYAKEAKIVIDWATDGASPTNYWEIQRSSDGLQFTSIALVLGPDSRQVGDKYQATDKLKDNKAATAYYRLRHIGTDGKEQLSNIIQLAK
jgi:trimeric autotransporter adhesin